MNSLLEKGTKKINNNIDIEEDYLLRANELLETFRLEFVKKEFKKNTATRPVSNSFCNIT
jgi:hypothetical protein